MRCDTAAIDMNRREAICGLGALLAALRPVAGRADTGPEPTGYLRSNWGRDPLALGSYSYAAQGSSAADRRQLAEPVGGRLFFAGEACHATNPGPVHAAYQTGQTAAEQVWDTDAETIGVVGAGMAGLSAASWLALEGYAVTVLEARTRIGGRILTDAGLGLPLDLGASWIHGTRGNPLTALARQAGASTQRTGNDMVLRGQGGRWIDADEAPDWFWDVSEIEHEFGAVRADLAPDAMDEAAGYGGGDVIFPDGGYATILPALAAGYDLQLAAEVVSIRHDDRGVTVQSTAGQWRFDALVITVPLGVLKSGSPVFDPPLPAPKRAAIDRLRMGLLDKLYLRFDHAFWDDATWIGTPENGLPQGQFNAWLNLHRYTGEPILMGFNGAGAARHIAQLDDEEVLARAVASLHGAYPG